MSRSLIPNSTQIPDVILDHWMAHLSGAELKVVLYIARRTYGFGKESDTISLNQISRGIRTRQGVQLDWGTGLSRSSVKSACASLVGRGILIKTQALVEGTGEPDENTYRLNLYAPIHLDEDSNADEEPESEVGQKTSHVGQKLAYPQNSPEVGQKLTHGGPKIRHGVGQFLAPQETVVQETVLQETAAAVAPTEKRGNRASTKAPAAALGEKKADPLDPETQALAQRLQEAGLNGADARRLAKSHPEQAREQLEYLPFKTDLENPGAFLRRAIEEGFAPPKEVLQARQDQRRQQEKEARAAARRTQQATRDAQRRDETRRIDQEMEQMARQSPEAFDAFLRHFFAERDAFLERFSAPRIREAVRRDFDRPEKRRELFLKWRIQAGGHTGTAEGPEASLWGS